MSSTTTSSPPIPGNARTQIRRRIAAEKKAQTNKPTSTRAAGAGGSSATTLKLYTEDTAGLKVDPVVVLVISLSFIGSVFGLHIISKLMRLFSSS